MENANSLPVETVTAAELTEAAFLSSVGWSKGCISGTNCSDSLQHLDVTSSEVVNGSSKCLREIHCGSKVTSGQQSVEVKHFSSTGHTNSMAAVCEEAPGPLELGSFFASRISKLCLQNRVQLPPISRKTFPRRADIFAEQNSKDSHTVFMNPVVNASHGENPPRKFSRKIVPARAGQNALLKKGPILDRIVNLCNILWYPIGKAVNFELAPEKENVESRVNFRGHWDRDVAGGEDMQEGRLLKGCESKKAGHINLVSYGVGETVNKEFHVQSSSKTGFGRKSMQTQCEKLQSGNMLRSGSGIISNIPA